MVSLRGLKDLTNLKGEGRSDAERRLNVKGNAPSTVREGEAYGAAAVGSEEKTTTEKRRPGRNLTSLFLVFPCSVASPPSCVRR